MVREIEDGKWKWGNRFKEDWKELGVNSIGGWCNKVKDRGWLASKLREGRKKKGKKTTIRDTSPQRNTHRCHVQCSKSGVVDMFE